MLGLAHQNQGRYRWLTVLGAARSRKDGHDKGMALSVCIRRDQAEEMARWLRLTAGLAEEPNLVLSTHNQVI